MDIRHDFWIDATPAEVFASFGSEEGMDAWWTLESSVDPRPEGEYRLFFGEGYDWRAVVSRFEADAVIEWTLTDAQEDWVGTRVRFQLAPARNGTSVQFSHEGWGEAGSHYRISSYCWAMYLRLLKRYIQHGEIVPYDKRLEA